METNQTNNDLQTTLNVLSLADGTLKQFQEKLKEDPEYRQEICQKLVNDLKEAGENELQFEGLGISTKGGSLKLTFTVSQASYNRIVGGMK